MTPNELVLTFGGLHVCVQFGENRRRNATVRVSTDEQTHTHTHARTDRRKTILLSVPCYNAIAMGQIKIDKFIFSDYKYATVHACPLSEYLVLICMLTQRTFRDLFSPCLKIHDFELKKIIRDFF